MSGTQRKNMKASILEKRKARLLSPELGIAEPAHGGLSYAPFDDRRYSHRKIACLDREPWPGLMRKPAEELLSPDPFAASPFRDGGLAVWDSIAIPHPESSEKGGTIIDAQIQPLAGGNAWLEEFDTKYSHMVGSNQAGLPVRPAGPYVFDLTRMGAMGWMLAESAHALAHLRCDGMCESDAFGPVIRKSVRTALASLLHGLAFGVPVYVGPADDGRATAHPGAFFAVSEFRNPVLQIKKSGFGSPEPDGSCIACLWLYHVEPAPEGFVAKTIGRGLNDEWSGFPAIMAFAGWEGMDAVIHSRTKIGGRNEYHVMHAADMLDPRELKPCIQRGTNHLDMQDWVLVMDWIGSAEWTKLIERTPPLPCRDCYDVNGRTPGMPRKAERGKALELFEKARNECISITERAVVPFEIANCMAMGIRHIPRDVRGRNNRKRRAEAKRAENARKRMETIEAKMRGKLKTPLTENQRKAYNEMKKAEKKA